MNILKTTLLLALLSLAACNTDQNTADNVYEKNEKVLQQKANAEYSLEEVLDGMREWENVRSNEGELLELFTNYNGLNIDMSQFPQGSELHAYACILDGKLKFAVISEIYDNAIYGSDLRNYIEIVDVVYNDISDLRNQTYENHNFPLPTQYIQANEAINRIEDWNNNYSSWLATSLPMYKSFSIPTYSLAAQNYKVYFGLKNSEDNANVKAADLVLTNDAGIFYDTVLSGPPFKNQQKYYILSLI